MDFYDWQGDLDRIAAVLEGMPKGAERNAMQDQLIGEWRQKVQDENNRLQADIARMERESRLNTLRADVLRRVRMIGAPHPEAIWRLVDKEALLASGDAYAAIQAVRKLYPRLLISPVAGMADAGKGQKTPYHVDENAAMNRAIRDAWQGRGTRW